MGFKAFQFGVREDYGKEFYITFLTTYRYSLLQVAFDYGGYGGWIEWPYLQISMGCGRLFSFLLSVGRLGFSFDIAGRNWRNELFYGSGSQTDEVFRTLEELEQEDSTDPS